MKLIWSDKAVKNLTEILAYIDRDSPRNADLVAERIGRSIERLESFRCWASKLLDASVSLPLLRPDS